MHKETLVHQFFTRHLSHPSRTGRCLYTCHTTYITFHTPHTQGDACTPVFQTSPFTHLMHKEMPVHLYFTCHLSHTSRSRRCWYTCISHNICHLSHTSCTRRCWYTSFSHVTFHTPHAQGDAGPPEFHMSPFTHKEMLVHRFFTHLMHKMQVHQFFTHHLSHTSRTMRRWYTRISHNIYFKTLLTCGFRHGLDLSLIIKQSHPLQAKPEQKSIQYWYEKELIQLPLYIYVCT